MTTPTASPEQQTAAEKVPGGGADPVAQNVDTILAIYKREQERLGLWQVVLEDVGGFMGRPLFLACILLFVAGWMAANLWAAKFGWSEFDRPPFVWLQGILCLAGLLVTTVVLIKQERLSKFEEQRAHLDLQVTLLTEQKASKIIDLLEELRHDLPNVRNRHDPDAAAMKEPANPHEVLAEVNERREAEATRGEPRAASAPRSD